ncbi:MAG: transketolase [Magnetovibrio sp.]|nr:transketolase [Magnetovibrio sp.]
MRKTCLNMVYELAKRDERVVFVGSDLGPGVLDEMKHEMPDRFYMEGVAEQNIIGMAAGLAFEGFIPYVNTIATFITRRCYEQVAIDAGLHNLPIRLIGNGGGLVYAPLGPTHLAIEDMALMRSIPNMCVVSPTDADEMTRFMDETLDWPSPIYIRLGKGGDPIVSDGQPVKIGRANLLRAPGDVTFISTGVDVGRCLDAADLLARQGITAGVLNMHTVKPLDAEAVLSMAAQSSILVTVEEHVLINGLGSAVLEVLGDAGKMTRVLRLGLPDSFSCTYGSQNSMMSDLGLAPEEIARRAAEALRGPDQTTQPDAPGLQRNAGN